jgi:NAD(P)-dependent dehydrogenase (short-subunit alcohol dehydrogenase family)
MSDLSYFFRFPHDAAIRYAKEPDFLTFKGRLFIYGLDFRDLRALHHFCHVIKTRFSHLDALVNNAAQTVRRGPGYYAHLLPGETEDVPLHILDIVSVVDVFKSGGEIKFLEQEGGMDCGLVNDVQSLAKKSAVVHAPAMMSQAELIPSDKGGGDAQYPTGFLDRDDQQLDMQRENSWTLSLSQITTVEMVECTAINTFAPFILCNELVGLMRQSGRKDRFIVNVSAMEGQFYRRKTHDHPHTNMAKAAFNMLTRTSAGGLMQEGIYMTSVDTGWITDEKPVDQWDARAAPPPLDEVDAAMRIIDPILEGVKGGELKWGVFLKNYFPTRW